ncbi:hypothetical protein GCM10027605_38740 [Micromonospora zhanjiangensis]
MVAETPGHHLGHDAEAEEDEDHRAGELGGQFAEESGEFHALGHVSSCRWGGAGRAEPEGDNEVIDASIGENV